MYKLDQMSSYSMANLNTMEEYRFLFLFFSNYLKRLLVTQWAKNSNYSCNLEKTLYWDSAMQCRLTWQDHIVIVIDVVAQHALRKQGKWMDLEVSWKFSDLQQGLRGFSV